MEIDMKSAAVGFSAALAISIMAFSFFGGANIAGCEFKDYLFSPGSSDEIISMIRSAQNEIDVEMYVFTSDELALELVNAAKRGVRVRVLLEPGVESQKSTREIPNALVEGGVEVRWASQKFKLTHSKMMIIDGEKVLVGSINFSYSAQNKNREAAAILSCAGNNKYSEIFARDWEVSSPVR